MFNEIKTISYHHLGLNSAVAADKVRITIVQSQAVPLINPQAYSKHFIAAIIAFVVMKTKMNSPQDHTPLNNIDQNVYTK